MGVDADEAVEKMSEDMEGLADKSLLDGRQVDSAVDTRFFQVGGFIDNSYLSVKSHQIREFGVTLGYGSNHRNLLYNLSLELGQRGAISDGLIKENYFQFTIGLSYRDFLFSKGRKYN